MFKKFKAALAVLMSNTYHVVTSKDELIIDGYQNTYGIPQYTNATVRSYKRKTIYLVAPTYRQAKYWATSLGIVNKPWEHVHSPDVLKGADKDSLFLFVGQWQYHPHIEKIEEYIKCLKSR